MGVLLKLNDVLHTWETTRSLKGCSYVVQEYETGVKGVNKFRDKTEIFFFTTGKWFPPRGMLVINENIAKADYQETAADDRRYISRPHVLFL